MSHSHLHGTRAGECAYYTFLFSKVEVAGPLIRFYRFLGIVGCVVFLAVEGILLVMTVREILRCPRTEILTRLLHARMPTLPKIPTGGDYLQVPWIRRIVGMLYLVMMAFMVMVVEFTISWNGVNGINDLRRVGQAIPLAVGSVGLARVLYRGVRERIRGPGYGGGLDELDLALP